MKRHIVEKIEMNEAKPNTNEYLTFDEDSIYLMYFYSYTERVWQINYQLTHHTIRDSGSIYYEMDTHELVFVPR